MQSGPIQKAMQEFVCVEPGLIGQMKDDFVEMHELPAGADASISQKIIPM